MAKSQDVQFSTRFSLPSFVKRVDKLTDEQKKSIDRTGFGRLLCVRDQTLFRNMLVELMERWNDEKRAFVFPECEITISLLDVALILGIRVTGDPVVLPKLDRKGEYNGKIKMASLEEKLDSLGETNCDEFVSTFLLFTFASFLFPDAKGEIDARYRYLLQDLDKVNKFAWGAAVLEDIFHWLSKRKKENVQYVGGCLIFLQVWCFEHTHIITQPSVKDFNLPRINKWVGAKTHYRPWFASKFEELKNNEITRSLEVTFEESEMDIIKELIEAETSLYEPSSIATWPHVDGTLNMNAGLGMESESGSSTCHNVGIEKELTGPSLISRADVATVITSDENMGDDVRKENETLRKQNLELQNKLDDVMREVTILKDQLASSLKFEEQNMKLREEIKKLKKRIKK